MSFPGKKLENFPSGTFLSRAVDDCLSKYQVNSPSLKIPVFVTCNYIKNIFQHRYFSVNFEEFLTTPFIQNISRQLFLKVHTQSSCEEWKSASSAILNIFSKEERKIH